MKLSKPFPTQNRFCLRLTQWMQRSKQRLTSQPADFYLNILHRNPFSRFSFKYKFECGVSPCCDINPILNLLPILLHFIKIVCYESTEATLIMFINSVPAHQQYTVKILQIEAFSTSQSSPRSTLAAITRDIERIHVCWSSSIERCLHFDGLKDKPQTSRWQDLEEFGRKNFEPCMRLFQSWTSDCQQNNSYLNEDTVDPPFTLESTKKSLLLFSALQIFKMPILKLVR